MSIEAKIRNQIRSDEAGMLYFISDFAEHGNDVFISRVLSECVNDGLLLRIANGIYCKPIETRFGPLFPSVEELVNAIARRDNAQILPTGETAQNRLGLSTQVPMNSVYLTTGSARKLYLRGRTVTLKRSVPRNFACKNDFMAALIQALKSIGKDNLTEEHTSTIVGLLKEHLDDATYVDDLKTAPIWVRKILSEIIRNIKQHELATT
ncbi:MAG: hypothetical protein IKD78_05365 [Bacteroidales bacterium]|nr:hypothetical protein [Salinivirgaceae bacterium]MBR2771428.1 hypothetical protein [Bacteroidales bacterium]